MLVAPPGLKGLAVADTELGAVRGEEGFFHYRQHDAAELARRHSLEDVWTLQIDGVLPPAVAAIDPGPLRVLPREVKTVVDLTAAHIDDPMAALRVGILALASVEGRGPLLDRSPAARRDDAVRLAAVVPTILTRHHRRRAGVGTVDPDPNLSHASDYLRMLTGNGCKADTVGSVQQYLVATLDHGFNASTFTSRVVASTGADMAGCLVAAVGALSGPLHGGAPSRVLEMLDQIGSPERAESWVEDRLAVGHKIMGFGHAVYRAEDPRGLVLREAATKLGGELVERAGAMERAILGALARWRPEHRIVTNVEFWAAIVLQLAGIPRSMFTSTFAVSRSIGWSAHVLEQAGAGKILRPSARYVGPEPIRV